MRILYIFPHPDDESFGPAPAMSYQRRKGHEVHLLTLTKGGATKVRHKLGLSIDEMGEVRYKEMLEVEKVLDLSSMTVLNLPDSGLKEFDPIELEKVIEKYILEIEPNIVVTYPVHGISGFHDHLVCHGVVKRVFVKLHDYSDNPFLKRLAFFTICEPEENDGSITLNWSIDDEVDVVEHVGDVDIAKFNKALDCYQTYIEVINGSKVREMVTNEVYFELFQEDFDPPLSDLTDGCNSGVKQEICRT